MSWQKTRIYLEDAKLSAADRQSLAEDILVFIQTKAINENRGFNPETGRNKKFPKYTKEYAAKKGAALSDVDLILSGEMFTDMKVLSHNPESILIGFENGSKSNAKAEGNQLGSYGKSPNPSKARPFLGITKTELRDLLRNYK